MVLSYTLLGKVPPGVEEKMKLRRMRVPPDGT